MAWREAKAAEAAAKKAKEEAAAAAVLQAAKDALAAEARHNQNTVPLVSPEQKK